MEENLFREPIKEYVAHCVKCHSTDSLCLVPHGAEGETNGWVFACPECMAWVFGATVKITRTTLKRVATAT